MPIGGLLVGLGAVVSGIAVLQAGIWRGMTRFAILAIGLCFLLLGVLPAIIFNIEPDLVRELIWQLPWLAVGVGLFSRRQGDADIAKQFTAVATPHDIKP